MLARTFRAGLVVSALFTTGSLFLPVAAQEYMVVGVYGTRNAYRNSTAWIQVSNGWYDLLDFNVNTSENTLTAPRHAFTAGMLVQVFSTSTLPYPLTPHRPYYVCDISGDTFRLANYGSSTGCTSTDRVDLTDAGTGRLRIGRRRNFSSVLIDPVLGGLPAGVTSQVWCGTTGPCPARGPTHPGKVYAYGGGYTLHVRLQIPATAPIGSAHLTLTVEPVGAPAQQVAIPIEIHPEVFPIQLGPIFGSLGGLLAPPLPGLARWESTMKTLAAKWCNVSNPTEVMGFGVEYQVWFYDGASVYYKIADYLKDPAWRACGTNIARQYRDYVIANKGKIPGWRVFSRGLAQAYHLTGDAGYLDAVRYLALEGLASAFGGGVRDDYIRETAYVMDSMITYERLTGNRAPKLTSAADLLLGMFDQLFVSDTFVYQQIFMDGLAMRALIEYWDLTRDPRVPAAIKTALDWIWDHAWLPAQNKLMVNPEPLGPRCDWGCRGSNTDLINLTAPAYAWYWAHTGDRKYLDRGDALFSHAMDTDISYSGKIFSQNYTWSFDYVHWRTDGKLLP